MCLKELQQVERRLGGNRTVCITKLVHTKAQQVLLLLGIACEELEDDVQSLDSDIRKSVVRQNLNVSVHHN